ncbi:hypothetical protein C6P10_10920 [Weissella confusa]|nr:hypothetical protein C6P10_10920 [Weissella confusa]
MLILPVAIIAVLAVILLNATRDCMGGASGVGGPGWKYNLTQKNPSSVTPEKVAEFAHKNPIPGLVATNAMT